MFPCGFCVECRAKYASEWALRCVHEAALHDASCFGTLTYAKMPERGSLERGALREFMRSLREELAVNVWCSWDPGDGIRHRSCGRMVRRTVSPVKMYGAGEYGEENGRPHYHFLLFGFAFPDRAVLRGGKYPLFRSPLLERVWPHGVSSIGDLSYESAAYVARYVMKKVDQVGRKKKYNVDGETGEMVEIEPEFARMSRGGRTGRGLGYGWFERYGDEVHRNDSIVSGGRELPVPRYYDKVLSERDRAAFDVMKARRARKYADKRLNFGELAARELNAVKRLEMLERSI